MIIEIVEEEQCAVSIALKKCLKCANFVDQRRKKLKNCTAANFDRTAVI